jgi:hypothetical protein
MSGPLTQAMVLIKTEQWLQEVQGGLERRRQAMRAKGKCLTETEERLLALANETRALLRADPPSPKDLPVTDIDNGVGSGLSQYAFVGSIGPDFPAAADILALNQGWVGQTMHHGAPRRAWVQAGTTTFVRRLLEAAQAPEARLTPVQQRALRSYAIGHLSSVATDVILHPFVNQWVWDGPGDHPGPAGHRHFEQELDARLAQWFFHRADLHDGQSWEAYYIEEGQRRLLDPLMERYLEAFRATYGGDTPSEPMCARDPATCKVPKLTQGFLHDGYKNLTDWAIDVGYDHSPVLFGAFWVAAIGGFGALAINDCLSSVVSFNPLLGRLAGNPNPAEVATVRDRNLAAWRRDGFYGNESAWFYALDAAWSWSGYLFTGYSMLLTGPLWFDGLFGQGRTGFLDKPRWNQVYTVISVLKLVAGPVLNVYATDFWHRTAVRWSRLAVDVLQTIYESFWLQPGSAEDGVEGDQVARAVFVPRLVVFGTYLAAILVAGGTKAERTGPDGRETSVTVEDFLFGSIILVGGIAVALRSGVLERKLLEDLVGSGWPGTATADVDRFLPADAARASGTPVRLFPDTPEALPTASDGRRYYPEDEAPATPFGDRPARDEAARKRLSQPSAVTGYTLGGLFDRAAQLSGLLAMAAVKYATAGPKLRDHVSTIFKDWNLSYRTVQEWDELMDDKLGLLPAVGRWSDGLRADQATTDPAVLDRLEQELGISSLDATLHADFDHSGAAAGSATARCDRRRRPGAIVLANLDIDDDIPDPLPALLDDRSDQLDALKDDRVNAGNDQDELTPLQVRRARSPATAGHELVLRVHADDQDRIRLFEVIPPTPDKWLQRLGPGSPEAALPAPPDQVDFRVEALTLPGDPARPAPSGMPPAAAGLPARTPGDVWVELVHRDAGVEVPGLGDVALLTIAPFLLLSNLQPTERVYVAYFPGLAGNHPTVADLVAALEAALGAAAVAAPTRPVPGGGRRFLPHRPVRPGSSDEARKLYIVDGDLYPDQWVQDQFELGYCWAPARRMHVVLHSPRPRPLEQWVTNELPSKDLGLFNSLSGPASDNSINYGGNLEVSPPVAAKTPAMPVGAGGPDVPAHPAAPLGKILLGEGQVFVFDLPLTRRGDLDAGGALSATLRRDFFDSLFELHSATTIDVVRAGSEWKVAEPAGPKRLFLVRKEGAKLMVYFQRLAAPDYRRFLEAQAVQPILPLDTAWLKVGHVDEYLTVVPATGGGKSFKLLLASSRLAVRLLRAARALHNSDRLAHPLTDLFRGQVWQDPPAAARISVDDVLASHGIFNEDLQTARLTPMRQRLKDGLALADDDIVELPVLFHALPYPMRLLGTVIDDVPRLKRVRTAAFTPCLVNLLVVDGHVIVPRPFGPRLLAADAVQILGDLGLTGVTVPRLAQLVGHWHWARRGDALAGLAATFAVGAAAIKSHPRNAGAFTGANNIREEWTRIFVPEDNVDLFEAFTTIVLEDIGLSVHFVDDWENYHSLDGEVHCGTNVKRTPPEAAPGYAGPQWWEAYAP